MAAILKKHSVSCPQQKEMYLRALTGRMVATERISPRCIRTTLILTGFLVNIILSPVLGGFDMPGGAKTFADLKWEHARICETDQTCEPYEYGPESPQCCGKCSCDSRCVQRGSCCLKVHKTFEEARASLENSRYDCILSQYLSSAETYIDWGMRYWMINKCHPGFTDNAIIEQCAQPSHELETVLPVTDPVTNTHYRNKNCALCNNVDDDIHLISWKFLIYNTREFVGRVSEETLLKFVRETMGNILFQPPAYIKVQTCYVPPYSISTCNETGLWPEYMYNENIENACHSFLDPFNLTYKNYFCFLCNTAENVSPKNWNCVQEPLETEWPMGSEDLVLDVNNDTSGALDCGSLQFEDDKMAVCRDVFCQHGEVSDGECTLPTEYVNSSCLALFIHLTPMSDKLYSHTAEWREQRFKDEVAWYLTTKLGVDEEVLQEILVFSSKNGVYVEYVVVYTSIEFEDASDKNSLIEAFMMKHKTNISLYYRPENEVIFFFELREYNMTRNSRIATVSVLREPGVSVKYLSIAVPEPKTDTCVGKEKLALHKLVTCPYIVLSTDELPMKMEKEFLIFTDPMSQGIDLKILSKWDYRTEGDTIHICLEDYIPIYDKMSKPATGNGSPTSTANYQEVDEIFTAVCLTAFILINAPF